MNYGQGIKGRLVIGSATVSHVLAWAAFLWIVLWPHAYQGVSATPVSVDGIPATEVVEARHSASFIGVNGYRPLVLLFIPVLATGLALIFLLTRTQRRTMNAPGFCGPWQPSFWCSPVWDITRSAYCTRRQP